MRKCKYPFIPGETAKERKTRCAALYHKERYNNDPIYKERKKQQAREKYSNGKLKKIYKYSVYKRGAKVRKLLFLLTKKEFEHIISKCCVYCGDKDNIGVDRVDNTIGYVLENCAPCCTMCNYMKTNNNKEVFIKQCKKIANNN